VADGCDEAEAVWLDWPEAEACGVVDGVENDVDGVEDVDDEVEVPDGVENDEVVVVVGDTAWVILLTAFPKSDAAVLTIGDTAWVISFIALPKSDATVLKIDDNPHPPPPKLPHLLCV